MSELPAEQPTEFDTDQPPPAGDIRPPLDLAQAVARRRGSTLHASRAAAMRQPRCEGRTKAGLVCRNRPLPGSSYCGQHHAAASSAPELAAALAEDEKAAAISAAPPAAPATTPAQTAPVAASSSLDPEEAVRKAARRKALLESGPRQVTDESPPPSESHRSSAAEDEPEPDAKELRSQLNALVVQALQRLGRNAPEGISPSSVLDLIERQKIFLQPDVMKLVFKSLQKRMRNEYFEPDTWRGLWMVLRSGMSARPEPGAPGQAYTVDPYGWDEEFYEAIKPIFIFMYEHYWRVEAVGLDRVPSQGRVLLVSNHSGTLPYDAAMIAVAASWESPTPRMVRALHLDLFGQIPFISEFLARTGQVRATPQNATTLLEQDEAVLVFPEGLKGVGKLYRDRYRLARFGRGGFVRVAMDTGAPIVPVAVVGAEEIHPMLMNIKPLASAIGFPYFPITPTFPWLGLMGFVPLPTKWTIFFGEPIPTAHLDPGAADRDLAVLRLQEDVRDQIQAMLFDKLRKRVNPFVG